MRGSDPQSNLHKNIFSHKKCNTCLAKIKTYDFILLAKHALPAIVHASRVVLASTLQFSSALYSFPLAVHLYTLWDIHNYKIHVGCTPWLREALLSSPIPNGRVQSKSHRCIKTLAIRLFDTSEFLLLSGDSFHPFRCFSFYR